MYNQGVKNVRPRAINYQMAKHNYYWLVPESEITANLRGRLSQNFGYSGYDASVPVWSNWQDAIADEKVAN